MIRVRLGEFPISHNLNDFHSQSDSVVDAAFAVNKYGTLPPSSTDLGLYGVDKADPQPFSYPEETTFFLRTSVLQPLVPSSVGTSYIAMNLIKNSQNAISYSVAVRHQYTGTVKKVWDAGELLNFPLDLNQFQPSPGTPYYIRFFDSFDRVKFFFRKIDTLSDAALVVVPQSFGWVENTQYTWNEKIIFFSLNAGEVSLSYGTFEPTYSLGFEWTGSLIDSITTAKFYVIQSI